MNKVQYKERLWEEYLAAHKFAAEQAASVKEIGLKFRDDVSFLYQLHACMLHHGGAMEDERTKVQYEVLDEYHILKLGNTEAAFSGGELARLVIDMIDIFEDVLPLGSVVDLNKEFLRQTMPLDQVENVRMVITKRFFGAGDGGYYPYGAAVYPVGMSGEGRSFCFSSALITRVVHSGYADEMEDAFVYELKHRLIVEQGRKSMGFANEEEQEAMRRFLMKEGGGDGKR